jgi:hypothetical protein
MSTKSIIDYKLSFIEKDYETAYKWYEKHENNIKLFRAWSLTIFIGYIGFIFSFKAQNYFILIPVGFVFLLFMFLEAKEQFEKLFFAKVVHEILEIFMVKEVDQVEKLIKEYIFKNLRSKKQELSLITRIRNIVKHMITLVRLTWYLTLYALIIISYLSKSY